jgi:hypothetical protein
METTTFAHSDPIPTTFVMHFGDGKKKSKVPPSLFFVLAIIFNAFPPL